MMEGGHDHPLCLSPDFRAGIGETKDLRTEWALQETGLPYRVHGLDHTAGELDIGLWQDQPVSSGAGDRR
ncbi:MAG: hypothetical protein K2Y27_11890 [Xanthobacteraceae bacterium]|nr:hypothetical protein [Xanthobacteraceae bacterium]